MNKWLLKMKLLFDLTCSSVTYILFAIPMPLTTLAIKLTSPVPILYWSDRVGHKKQFRMTTFHTMRTDSPSVTTHLLIKPERWLTWERIRKIAADWLPYPHILHPWPNVRFNVNIQGGNPDWNPAIPVDCVTYNHSH